MSLELLRLLSDVGLAVLIWMVQLLIYPSFKYCSPNELLKWHKRYTTNMALIVIPLMFAQLIIYGILVFQNQTLFNVFGMCIVLSLWLSTFLLFVPLHQHISNNNFSEKTLTDLENRNWIRTALWTLLVIWSFLEFV